MRLSACLISASDVLKLPCDVVMHVGTISKDTLFKRYFLRSSRAHESYSIGFNNALNPLIMPKIRPTYIV